MSQAPQAEPESVHIVGPVQPSAGTTRLSPVSLEAVQLQVSGWWGAWQLLNRETTLPYGLQALKLAGNIDNFLRVIGQSKDPYRGFVFNDSDLYKTLEAAAWVQAQREDPRLQSYAADAVRLLQQVQAPDGYLNTFVQGEPGRERYTDLAESHELYCAGHLLQAAVADFRATGGRGLLDVALRVADHLVNTFGEGRRRDYDGHPEVETALVELFRATGSRSYLELAKQFVDDRGQQIFSHDRRGNDYFQDTTPVRATTQIAGHAVRALYLEAGVVDVATETGDSELLQSSLTRWRDMNEHKLYLTGGVGSRHKSEGFGDPFELPPDRAYCETCAAIASIHWNWRLLLATGEARFADLLERTLYNGFAAGTGRDGTSFFYSNPLQVRAEHAASNEEESGSRLPWYGCACCPPNIMRLLASLQHYLATTDEAGIQIHQYTEADLAVPLAMGAVRLAMSTRYPWAGAITVRVEQAPDYPWTLSLRVPPWAGTPELTVNGKPVEAQATDGYLRLHRTWAGGDLVALTLDVTPRRTRADPRVDAVRGCTAVERGPLVYCFEGVDNPGSDLAEVAMDPAGPMRDTPAPDWTEVQAVVVSGQTVSRPGPGAVLYTSARSEGVTYEPVDLVAIPYYLWSNRANGPMRVWLPAVPS